MKIMKYSSEQFAGMRDVTVEFKDGMNVILGNNESGKSTLISGIYSTLFVHTTPKRANDPDYANFKRLYGPTAGGDYIDGVVEMENNNTSVKVTRQWFGDAQTKIRIDNNNYSSNGAKEQLDNFLHYGRAFYNNIIFDRQNRKDIVLDWIFDSFKQDGKDDIKKKLSELTSIIGGIDPDRFKKKLEMKISMMLGNWDFDTNSPKKDNKGKAREVDNQWTKNNGTIIKAYYQWQEAKKRFDEQETNELEIKNHEKELETEKDREKNLKHQILTMNEKKSHIDNKENNKKLLGASQESIEKLNKVKEQWPLLIEENEQAVQLQKEQEAYKNQIKAQEIQQRINEYNSLQEQISAISITEDIDELTADYQKAIEIDREIEKANIKLNAGQLSASIKTLGSNHVIITDASGNPKIVDGENDIDVIGYADINIPDVATILIHSKEQDVLALKRGIKEWKYKLTDILGRYNVSSTGELKQYKEQIESKINNKNILTTKMTDLMALDSIEALKETLQELKNTEGVSVRKDIDTCVKEFLSKSKEGKSFDVITAVCSAKISEYEKEYETAEHLDKLIEQKQQEIDKYSDAINKLKDVDDAKEFEQKLSALNNEQEKLVQAIVSINKKLAELNSKTDDMDAVVLKDDMETKKQCFKTECNLYECYRTILKDFTDLKDTNNDNPIDKFKEKLREYLSFITGGQLLLSAVDENLAFQIKSGNNPLTFKEILSEGTKETLLLAYRLAVLDFFFRDEGGFIVLDDVILDMDSDRRQRSVELLRKFAQNNQIIFTTCDQLIAKMLGGNKIEL